MTVFVDTFALIAWLNPRDDAHPAVAAYLDGFTGRLLTTEWVLMELADALSSPQVRSTAVAFLRAVRVNPLFDVVGYVPTVYWLREPQSREFRVYSFADILRSRNFDRSGRISASASRRRM